MSDIRLILDNIRSVHNVGSIFRTAETLGISRIYCLGTTPVPLDRFGRRRKDFAKVALGAERMIAWKHIENETALKLLEKMKLEGFYIIALEQDKAAVDYKKVKIRRKTAIVLGNEVNGVSKSILESSSVIAEIPLRGSKESLNASVAAGIFLFRLLDQNY